jgi:hypothetical protein
MSTLCWSHRSFDVDDRAGASVESIVVGTNLFIIPLSLIAMVL